MQDTILSLCDYTGHMVQPWVEAGYRAILVDPQHPEGVHTDGLITRVGHVIDDPVTWQVIRDNLHRLAFVAGFPPCTDLAVSGARWFQHKAEQNPAFQHQAMHVVYQCQMIGELSGAPWFLENPISQISSYWRKPDHTFHPWHFTTLEAADQYTKPTCLWVGGGFVMPGKQVRTEVQAAVDQVVAHYGRMVPIKRLRDDGWSEHVTNYYPDSRIHFASPGENRGNIRSATPMGFARAIFEAHKDNRVVADPLYEQYPKTA